MTTMLALVDLDTVKTHCRILHDQEDAYLTQLIESASAMVVGYLEDENIMTFVDSDGMLISSSSDGSVLPDEIIWAVLYLVGIMYRDRDGSTIPEWTRGYLPSPVVSSLYKLRAPTIA